MLATELLIRVRQPARLLRALGVAWRHLCAWWRRWLLTTLFVLAAGSAAVGGALWFSLPHGPTAAQPPRCDDGTFRQATVTARVKLEVDGLAYPRMTSDLEISVPRNAPAAEFLLSRPDGASGQAAFSCLLGYSRDESEVREAPPTVVTNNGALVVTQHTYVDLVSTSEAWADFTQIKINTTGDLPWALTMYSPEGLRYAKWDVTLTAPARWLSTPQPVQSAELGGEQLHWPPFTPAASRDGNLSAFPDYTVVSTELRPDTRSAFSAAATDRDHKPFVWGAYWLSALIFALFVRWVLRAPRGRVRFEPSAGRRSRRAARILPYVVVFAGTQAVTDAVLPGNSPYWPKIAWIAATVLLGFAGWSAMRWWMPRIPILLLLAVGSAASFAARPVPSGSKTFWQVPGTVALAFLITLLLVAGMGKALLVLVKGQMATPRWLWWVSSTLSAALVLEELVLQYVNNLRQQWLGAPPLSRDVARLFRYYPLDLLDEVAWPALLVGAVAVWRRYADYWFERDRQSPMPVAIALFVLGPMWWDVHIWGVWWWAWLVGTIPLALLWLLVPKLWKPVLEHHSVTRALLEPAPLRQRAAQWLTDGKPRGPEPTPVHVLIASGPGGSPLDTMRSATRFAVLPSLIAGAGLLTTEWVIYPHLSINQQDSLVLTMVDAVAWEAVKWLLAAAALGLSWQHLPGNRGPAKVLPIVLTYATAPIGQLLLDRASGGLRDWVPLADAALFTLVMLFVALRLDFAAQADLPLRSATRGRVGRVLATFGLSDVRSHIVEVITLVAALLAIWTALTGGEVSFPSIDPAQFSRK
ncbi:DUF6185 family protein [Amycolatopsis sp. FBCC-B4732]|uniref:DUF6185 family protein n=1 Tax=Amycolatopsis sp. FBCC-B4732 TaxID=3079339 RepID=UPI001FF2B70E|nr:DUF6185 family protein [Amycolatopsis sp. FBCC-B4732]UOX88780.1 DUF6185 family protein [Amycolatopsis sp. FBCC-B4732]